MPVLLELTIPVPTPEVKRKRGGRSFAVSNGLT
jgi:hypothetical protein